MLRSALVWLLLRIHEGTRVLLRRFRPEWRSRFWSNAELRRWAPLIHGDIINVSGWMDEDKEGGTYASYFTKKRTYVISNIPGARGSDETAVCVDLSADLPARLTRSFDAVFCHTVLEHVLDFGRAVRVLCELSRDLVVVVVPFSQQVHWEKGSYLDYWRPTPFALIELFAQNGLTVVYWSSNPNSVYPIYLFAVASRSPDAWSSHADSIHNEWAKRMP